METSRIREFKNFCLAALLMAGAALAACSGDDNIVKEQPANPAQHTYTMTIEATKGGDAATTRALALDGKTLNATWQTTDEVAVYNYTQQAALGGHLSPQSDGASATLTGSLTGSVAEGDIVYLLWPSVNADYTGQDGTLETIAQRYDYTKGVAKVTSVDGTTIGAEDSSPNGGPVLFTNSQAIVKFTLIDKATNSPINATQLTIDAKVNGESRLIQSITYPDAYKIGPITINRTTPADNVVYAALPFSSTASFTFNLAATDGTNTYTYEKADVTMLNGRYYEVTVKMTNSQATPLTFEAKEPGARVKFNIHTSTATNPVKYSTDGSSWKTYTSGTAIELENVGDKVMFCGDNATYATSTNYSYFHCDKGCYVYGNLMSLISSSGYSTATELTAANTFRQLFYYYEDVNHQVNSHILNHPSYPIVLPATTLTERCYDDMFKDCTGLTQAPALPATTLAAYCYNGMFWGCSGLTTAPTLPATTLANGCYSFMFYECTALAAAPALPATEMKDHCYSYMFYQCASLTKAPTLPATKLANYCYMGLFNHCSNLNSITCLATDISAQNCTQLWTEGVAATGTFTKAGEMTGWTTGVDGIPEGWTVTYTLAESTVGMIVGSDGKAYAASDKNNLPSGVTAVAMVAYKNGNNGLAIALADEGQIYWNDATSTCEDKDAIGSYSWKFPSQAEWQQMFSANGGDASSYSGLNSAIRTAGGTALEENKHYWSSSTVSGKQKETYAYAVYLKDGSASWIENSKAFAELVRACLAF